MEQPEDLQSPEDLPPALQEPTRILSGVAGAGGPDDPDPTEEDEVMLREADQKILSRIQQPNSPP